MLIVKVNVRWFIWQLRFVVFKNKKKLISHTMCQTYFWHDIIIWHCNNVTVIDAFSSQLLSNYKEN